MGRLSHIPYPLALIGASLLAVAEMLLGTSGAFAALVWAFAVAFTVAFNTLGGLTTPNGIATAIMGFSTVLCSQVAKVIFLQPADSNLQAPVLTLTVMVAGMAATAVGALLSRRLKPRRGLLDKQLSPEQLALVVRVASAASLAVFVLGEAFPEIAKNPVVFGLVRYLSVVPLLAFYGETTRVIEATDGRRSLSWLALFNGALIAIPAVYGLWKGALLMPFLGYAFILFNYQVKLRWRHIAAAAALALFLLKVFFPLANLGHRFIADRYAGGALRGLAGFAADYANGRDFVAEGDAHADQEQPQAASASYFGEPKGFLDRLSLVWAADRLIADSAWRPAEGWSFFMSRMTLLPQSLTGVAASEGAHNYLARRTGIIAENDLITGISFGVFADTYATLGFYGLALILPLICFATFALNNVLVSSAVRNLWGIVIAMLFEYVLTETSATSMIFYCVRTIPFILAVIIASRLAARAVTAVFPATKAAP